MESDEKSLTIRKKLYRVVSAQSEKYVSFSRKIYQKDEKNSNLTFVKLNSNVDDRCTRRSWPWAPSLTVAHSLRPSPIEGHPIYYGPKSNAFIRQAFQRDDQVEREKGCWEEKRCAYGRVKKKPRTKRRDADGWRATIESCFSATKATRRATRSPSARQGVARRLDHYRHCPLMDIYECTNQRHHYRASMQSESII